MLQKFDELVKQRKELQEWWKPKTTVANYNNKYYTLRVDTSEPSMIAFCGQQYAGDKNYYDAPSFFSAAVIREMDAQSHAIVEKAYNEEMQRLNDAIDKHRAAVLAELAQAAE